MRSLMWAALSLLLFCGLARADAPSDAEPSADDPPAEEPEPAPPSDAPDPDPPSDPDRIEALEALVRQLSERVRELESHDAEPAPAEAVDLDLDALSAALEADTAEKQETAPPPAPARRTRGPAQSFNPDISFIADFALAWFSTDDPLQTGAHDPQVNGFNLQQLELAIGAPVDPYFRFDGNIVFSQFGVEIEEIYATTTGLPAGLQFRVGQFLTRYGRLNATHPHTWEFVDQAFPLGRVVGGEGNRGLGAEASILMPFPWYFEVLGSLTMANGAATALSFFGGDDLGVKTPLDFESVVAIKQFYPLGADVSLLWGVSWASGPNATGRDNRTDLIGTDLFLKIRPVTRRSPMQFTFLAELIYRRRQVPVDIWSDVGLVTQLQWRFAQRWAVAARYELGTPTLNLEGTTVVDPLDPAWTANRHRGALNVTFWPTEFSRLRLQGGLDAPLWRDDLAFSAVLALEFNLGAHGAHSF